MNFDQLGLSTELLRAVEKQGYSVATPIQAQAIPAILRGDDILASAQTGTGKTAGFTLPLLQQLAAGKAAGAGRPRALILTPTRELAAQIQNSIEAYGCHLPVRSTVVFGGVNIKPQISTLRRGVDILVATPGRLLDLHQQGAVNFDDIKTLVLDEADRMLDMGFIHDIRRILRLLPKQRQNLLFSATYNPELQGLARSLLHKPVEINVAPMNTAAEKVEQTIHPVDRARKPALLSHLIREHGWHQALVFSRTKHGANKLVRLLENDGIQAAAIHGNKSQAHRTRVLAQFKTGQLQILVATDIAARGIDIDQLPQVVNFDLPQVAEDYVHRIGRTGRAGASGQAVSLVSSDENKQLRAIERLLQRRLPQNVILGFEPDPNAPRVEVDNTSRAPAKRGSRRPQPSKARASNRPLRHAPSTRSPGNQSPQRAS